MKLQPQRKLKVGCVAGFFVLFLFVSSMSNCLFVKLGVELLNLYYTCLAVCSQEMTTFWLLTNVIGFRTRAS